MKIGAWPLVMDAHHWFYAGRTGLDSLVFVTLAFAGTLPGLTSAIITRAGENRLRSRRYPAHIRGGGIAQTS